jgi:hypothetical protein
VPIAERACLLLPNLANTTRTALGERHGCSRSGRMPVQSAPGVRRWARGGAKVYVLPCQKRVKDGSYCAIERGVLASPVGTGTCGSSGQTPTVLLMTGSYFD